VHSVVDRRQLSPNVTLLEVTAPRIAEIRLPGQFVIVHLGPGSERIPLTVADADADAGTITLVIQAAGKSTGDLAALVPGGEIRDIAGPLGHPTELPRSGSALCIGGGVGTAVLFPIVQGLQRRGVRVTSVIRGRSRDWVILERELRLLGPVVTCTDDGSLGRKGFVTDAAREILASGGTDVVYAVGPVPMMRAVAELTRPLGIRTIVSLNPIMIDGTGMCGGCRVSVGGGTRFACVDGPDFDGHAVDFDQLAHRLGTYQAQEGQALAAHHGPCRLDEAPSRPQAGLSPVAGATRPGPVARLSARERLSIPRQAMPEQEAAGRARNFEEVNFGFTEKLALLEAQRCLQCKEPRCMAGCPVMMNIPRFIDFVAKGDFPSAAASLLGDNALAAITGRVCPQETQCEIGCVRGIKSAPVAIGHLERFVADWARGQARLLQPPPVARTGRRIAIVGSGPGGLTAAGELAREGHEVTIYEALHQPGGVLVYGIPEFRLPKQIVAEEVDRLVRGGVHIECNVVIGRTYTLDDLRRRFDAVFIANGAGLPVFMNVPGESLRGVYSANEYLIRINLMAAYRFPQADTPILPGRRVAVVGGGNVALDAARTGGRLGAISSTIVYRRTRKQMPARIEEVHHAEQEGVRFEFLAAPLEVLGNADRRVTGLRCIRMRLGDLDPSGRRTPVPIPGSEFTIDCDTVVVAVGTRANPLLTSTCPDLKLDSRGNIQVDQDGMTNLPGVFAGGDIVRGAATVILAMGDGKRAARAIHAHLS
jgi:glutamate synthase (NADPH) small chain